MKTLFILIGIALVASCGNPKQSETLTQEEIDARLIEHNKQLTGMESTRIDEFAKEKGWPVKRTGTGLRYWIYEDIDGMLAVKGQEAMVDFEVTLLNGTVCYTTQESGPKQFRIEQSNVESGVHEVVQYMNVGDKAKVIIPSHLAHGLAGDMAKIPLKSTIVYDLELIDLK